MREGRAIDGSRSFEVWRSVILHRWLQLRNDNAKVRSHDILAMAPAE